MKLSEIKKIRRTKNNWTFREVDSLYEAYRRSYFGTSSPPTSPRAAGKRPFFDVGDEVYLPYTNERAVITDVLVQSPHPELTLYKIQLLTGHFSGTSRSSRGVVFQGPTNLFHNQNFGTGPPHSPRRDPATKPDHTPIHDRYSVGQPVEITDTREQGVIQEVIVDHSQPLNIWYKVKIISGRRINTVHMFRGWWLREPLEAAAKNY